MTNNVIKFSQYSEEGLAPDRPLRSDTANTGSAQGENNGLTMNKAFIKAKQIVDSANELSARIIRETNKKLESESAKIREQSYQEGFLKGVQDGKEAGMDEGFRAGCEKGAKNAEEERRAFAKELSSMIESVEINKMQILKKFEEDIVKLSLDIAEKVIRQEISLNWRTLTGMIKNATDSYRNQAWVRIVVSEKTAELNVKADNEIIRALANVSDNIKVIPNPGMSDSDCLIELPDQIIDLSVDTQLENILKAIGAVVQKRRQQGK